MKANLTLSATLQELVRKVGTLPLIVEPGTAFHYSVSIDVLGYLVQVASGMPFDEFLGKRLLRPLQMNDTYFLCRKRKSLESRNSIRGAPGN
jgi:CubicO group peptidase (beta-lactamase class C family)